MKKEIKWKKLPEESKKAWKKLIIETLKALGEAPEVVRDRFLAWQKVRDDTAAGPAKGVRATPTLFVNGRKLEGVQSIEQLRAVIDPLVK